MKTLDTDKGSSLLDKVRNSLSAVREWMDDPAVTDIMINKPNDVWIQKGGTMFAANVQISARAIESAITLLAGNSDIVVRESGGDSIVSTKLPGFRVEAAVPPVAVDGPTICLRRHNVKVMTLETWVESGALPQEVADYLRQAVRSRLGIFVVGSTGSGKTTFVNTLIGCIDPEDRLVTIEEVPELLIALPNRVRLQINHQQGITATKLLRTTLRMNPSRIILGEARGAEANDLLMAANTGHPGAIVTFHANSALHSPIRFEDLVAQSDEAPENREAIRERIASTFSIAVFMTLVGDTRIVAEIVSIDGYDKQTNEFNTQVIYRSSKYEKHDLPTLRTAGGHHPAATPPGVRELAGGGLPLYPAGIRVDDAADHRHLM